MPYDEELDERIKKAVGNWKNTDSRKMFGGVCHLLSGNMFGGVYKDYLILRLGEEESREALRSPNVHPFDITGRPMKGWVMVDRDGYEDQDDLDRWLAKARGFVETLPPK
jgi:TfoX/Sxy family transcriptional regulator of competence genes